MELSEMETQILINEADRREGYFRMYTSVARIAEAILERFRDVVLDTKTTQSREGRTTSWDFKISADVLPSAPFLKRKLRVAISQERKDLLSARLKAIRKLHGRPRV